MGRRHTGSGGAGPANTCAADSGGRRLEFSVQAHCEAPMEQRTSRNRPRGSGFGAGDAGSASRRRGPVAADGGADRPRGVGE